MGIRQRLAVGGVALIVVWLMVSARVYLADQGITIQWDANDVAEDVEGYLVYVGIAPGNYVERYDVGAATSFTYDTPIPGQRYFFAVSAYGAGRLEGPRSPEVTVVGPTLVGTRQRSSEVGSAGTPPAPVQTIEEPCAQVGSLSCRLRLAVDDLGAVTALSATDDGRLFFVQNSRHVRVVVGATLVPEAALSVRSDQVVLGVSFDPSFAATRYVFVGIGENRGDGGREFSIVRFRERQNVLGEAAVVVSGLRLDAEANAPFVVGPMSYIFVAMPGTERRSDLYGEHVLRFSADGTVPAGNWASSPILAMGYTTPAALEWDGTALWMSGARAGWPPVTTLRLGDSSRPLGPAVPARVNIGTDAGLRLAAAQYPAVPEPARLAFLDSADRVVLSSTGMEAPGSERPLDWGSLGTAVAVDVDRNGLIYVALQAGSGRILFVEARARQ